MSGGSLSGGWEQVYAGCHVDTSIEPRYAKVFPSPGRGLSKAQGKRPTEGTDWTPVPSAPGGISVALDSSSAAARRGSDPRAPRETSMHGRISGANERGGRA